jgi:cysteine desulfurase
LSETDFLALAPIYLDYHASTPVDAAVIDAMLPWWQHRTGNPHSEEHSFGWRARAGIELAKTQIASLIRVDAEDIIFTSGATEANNLALLGLMRFPPRRRNKLLVSAIEHASVLGPAFELRKEGIEYGVIPVAPDGTLNRDAFLTMLDDDVLLVSVGAVNGEVGTIQDISWIADQCHERGALLHTDGAQALTAIPSLLGESGADLVSISAHKAYGPQGVGALYIAPGITNRMVQLTFGGGQQSGLRPGTLPTALCVGFGAACDLLSAQGAVEREEVARMRDAFITNTLRTMPEATINGPRINRHPGNISLQLLGVDAREIIQRVQPAIALSTGSACHSGSNEPSGVLRAIGLTTDQAFASLRLGIGRFTTVAQLDAAIELLATASLSAKRMNELPTAYHLTA